VCAAASGCAVPGVALSPPAAVLGAPELLNASSPQVGARRSGHSHGSHRGDLKQDLSTRTC
jgi:hypothetical protein